jgi:hypothetical protein
VYFLLSENVEIIIRSFTLLRNQMDIICHLNVEYTTYESFTFERVNKVSKFNTVYKKLIYVSILSMDFVLVFIYKKGKKLR